MDSCLSHTILWISFLVIFIHIVNVDGGQNCKIYREKWIGVEDLSLLYNYCEYGCCDLVSPDTYKSCCITGIPSSAFRINSEETNTTYYAVAGVFLVLFMCSPVIYCSRRRKRRNQRLEENGIENNAVSRGRKRRNQRLEENGIENNAVNTSSLTTEQPEPPTYSSSPPSTEDEPKPPPYESLYPRFDSRITSGPEIVFYCNTPYPATPANPAMPTT